MTYLIDTGLLCSLGNDRDEVALSLQGLFSHGQEYRHMRTDPRGRIVGLIETQLSPLGEDLAPYDCRNNRLAAAALEQVRVVVDDAINRYGPDRVGVVMGTSTSGIGATEYALAKQLEAGNHPETYHAIQGAMSGLGEFTARYLGIEGPAFTMSTACSSSGNAMIAARRLIHLGLCDAVVTGGVDSLCELTLQGFGALEALSASHSRPFTTDRDGINIGEAAAVFLLDSKRGPIRFCGGSCTSDAHHISAPHPQGRGAHAAMLGALDDAGLEPAAISYINLHGTGTPQNDRMESIAVHRIFGDRVPCSTTKPYTGHTLGAAAALELGFCWLLLSDTGPTRLPPTNELEERDLELAPIRLASPIDEPSESLKFCMSNSFAFGGNNVSLIIGNSDE